MATLASARDQVALDNREKIRSSFGEQRQGPDDDELTDSTLYGAVTSGLYAAALGETVMYAEDLFVLLRGMRDPQRFVAQTIEYPGGKISGLATKLENLEDPAVARLFFIPPADRLGISGTDADRYKEAITTLRGQLHTLIRWWRRYRFLQQQYKHGGTLALRPFSNTLPTETIERRKRGEAPPLYVLDNAALNDESLERTSGVVSFVSSPGAVVLGHTSDLIKERNFLRYALTLPVPYEEILDVAGICCDLITIAIDHRRQLLTTRTTAYEINLPTKDGAWLHVVADDFAASIDDFSLKL